MNRNLILTVSVLSLRLSVSAVYGKTKEYAPLPDALMTAKTVCVINKSSHASVADRAYSELHKWFKIVQTPKDADLLFVFSSDAHIAGYRTSSSAYTHGTVDVRQTTDTTASESIHETTTGYSVSEPIVHANVFMHVVQPGSGEEIWSNVESMGIHGVGHQAVVIGTLGYGEFFMHPSASREIIKDLRKRIENQPR